MIELYNEDNMKFMAGLKDNYFDLGIFDPEYGIGESRKGQSRPLTAKQKNGSRIYVSSARKHKVKSWDDRRPDKAYFDEIRRVTKNQIIWGGNHFADLLPASSGWIVWDKVNEGSDQSDCELAWTSFKRGVRQIEYMWNGFNQGLSLTQGRVSQGNKKLNEVRIQPCQKPVLLYKWLLHNYANEGDAIFDANIGSGSIAIACHDYKFDLVGCELDADYFNAAKKRLEQHQRQTTLF